MYMVVNDAGKEVESRRVNFHIIGLCRIIAFQHLLNHLVLNHYRTDELTPFVHDCRISDDSLHRLFFRLVLFSDCSPVMACAVLLSTGLGYFLNHPSHLNLMTPKKASPKMPLFIFDKPSTRLTKMTGTSLILKPHL